MFLNSVLNSGNGGNVAVMDGIGLVAFIVGFVWIPVAIFVSPVILLIDYLGGRWSEKNEKE